MANSLKGKPSQVGRFYIDDKYRYSDYFFTYPLIYCTLRYN